MSKLALQLASLVPSLWLVQVVSGCQAHRGLASKEKLRTLCSYGLAQTARCEQSGFCCEEQGLYCRLVQATISSVI